MELIQALKGERHSSSLKTVFNLPQSFQLILFSVSNCRPIVIVSPRGPFSRRKNQYRTFSDIIPNTPHFEYDQNKFTNDDYQLISPLFQNQEFCICPSNIELFGQLSNHFQCEELISLYKLCQGTFEKIGEIEQLIQIQEEVFKFNIQYFNDRKELVRKYSYYVACFLYVCGTSRPGQTVKLAEFASKLCEIDEQNGNSKEPELKESIREYFFSRLRINTKLRNYRFRHRYPFYLFRQFYDHNLLDQEELLETIFQLNNYDGLFWFLDILPPSMEEIMYDLMKEKDIRIYQHNAKAAVDLKANNFELFKSVVKDAISDNSIMQAIQNDDVESLKKELPQFTGQQNIFLTPIQLINGLLPTNELLSYAALYSSVNCYVYLLEQGFHPNKTTIRAALIGGNKEIIHLIWNEINHTEFFSTFLKDACRYHRNDVFEWIRGQISAAEIQSKGTKLVESIMLRSIQEFNFDIFLEFLHQHHLMHTLPAITAELGNPIIYEFLWNISNRLLPLNIYFLNEFTYDTIHAYNPNYQPNVYNQFNNPALFFKFFKDQLKNVKNFSQIQTNLLLAIQNHQYFPVQILFNMCRDIIVNECNTSKLGFLRHRVAEYSNPAILSIFLQDPRIDVNKTPENSNGTAFTLTICRNFIASSHILYNTGKIKINQVGQIGETPLTSCVSAEHQYPGLIDFLISLQDLDVNAKNKYGNTAIELAAERQYADAACVLLKRPDLIVSQNTLEKLVDLALYRNNRELFRALFKSGKLQITDLPLEDFCTRMNKPLIKEESLIPLWTNAKSDELQLQELIRCIYE